MKITIVQAEIETAIEDFLRQQIDIKDDQEIVIDLSATRGPEGFRAEIDIRKIEAPVQEATLNVTKAVRQARQPKAEVAKPAIALPNATAEGKANTTDAVTEGAADAGEVLAQEAAQSVTEAVQEASAAEAAVEAEPVADEAQTEAEPAPIATAKPSLFGGLKKPVNTKPAE